MLFTQLNELAQAKTNITSLRLALDAFQHLPPQEEFLDFLASRLPEDNSPIPSFSRLIQLIYERFGLIEANESAEMPVENKVNVTTLHSAKGMEAEYVCCMWMNGRFMPMADRDIEEERRVLYVALTRAKRDVMLTFFEEFDHTTGRRLYGEALSPFLKEIWRHLDIIRIRSKDIL